MKLPESFKSYPNITNINELIMFLDKNERSNFYAQFFELNFNISDDGFNAIAEAMEMQYLQYGDKNFCQFGEIHLENELHYDGISANSRYTVPDYLLFKVDLRHKVNGGRFRLLNSVSAINNLSLEMLSILKEHDLEFYGFPTFHNPIPIKDELTFSIKCIQKIGDKLSLRMHIPSEDLSMVVVEKDFIHCKIDDFRIRFAGMNGVETDKILCQLRKAIYTDKNLLQFDFNEKLLVVVNNNYVFHGRESTEVPDRRLMKRYQLKR